MNNDFLAKIMRFVKERGEKFIIVGQEDNEAVVIMPFSAYERGFSAPKVNPLTQQSEADKINLEIDALDNRQKNFPVKRNIEDWGGNESLETEDERYYMEPLE